MSFFFFIAFIVVVVVMQTAFAHVRSSTSVQEQANADFIEGLQFHRESILAQIPKRVASTETKEARVATLKLAGAKDMSVESFQNGFGTIHTSGWAFNVTRNTKSCSSGSIQYIAAEALGDCTAGPTSPSSPSGDYSYAMSCNVDQKKIEYGTGFWMGSTTCNNFDTPPSQMISSGVGNNCNVDRQKHGVYSGCGDNNFIRLAVTAKDSSIMDMYFPSMDDCMMNKPHFLIAYPLNGCMVTTDKKGKKVTGSFSYTDCTVSGSISARVYKSPDCKGTYQKVTSTSDQMFGAGTQCMTNSHGDVNRFVCNKPTPM